MKVPIHKRTQRERYQYFYDKIASNEMSIRNFELYLAVERTNAEQRGYERAIADALAAVGEDEELKPWLDKQDPAAIRNLYKWQLKEVLEELRGKE